MKLKIKIKLKIKLNGRQLEAVIDPGREETITLKAA